MILIRPEAPADATAIYIINKAAFDGRDAEPRLVDAIRQTGDFIPELSLVAEAGGRIVGHILFSRIWIEAEKKGPVAAIALAPVAVLPEFQNQGTGSALIR